MLVFYRKAGENYSPAFLHATLWWNISGNLPLISILPPRNITTELQAGRQTTRQIAMTQAVASKSIASAERTKNQLFIGPFLSVFVLLITFFFSNNLIFNKLLWEHCSNNLVFNTRKIATFIATFTSSRTVIATKTQKTPQLSSQLFGKAHATSGILGCNNLKKCPRNPGGTD